MSVEVAIRAAARRLVPRTLRNLLRSPARSARWLKQEAAYALGRRSTLAVRADWVVVCHPASCDSFASFARDEELIAELDGFIARCTPGMTLLDIGANFGFFCLAALRYGGPDARVVAVDPSATSNRILRANVRLAGALDRAQVIEAAVGADDGMLPMLTTGPAGDHYLVSVGAADDGRPDGQDRRMYSLPTILARTGWASSHVKIDVEGYEHEVIEGGMEFLQRARPVLFLELHGGMLRQRGRDPRKVLDRLAACGYDRFERHGRPIAPREAAGLEIARLVCVPVEA